MAVEHPFGTDNPLIILGLSNKDGLLTEADVRKAYRQKIREYHPDTSKDPAANDKTIAIIEAYKRALSIAKSSQKAEARTGSSRQTTPPPPPHTPPTPEPEPAPPPPPPPPPPPEAGFEESTGSDFNVNVSAWYLHRVVQAREFIDSYKEAAEAANREYIPVQSFTAVFEALGNIFYKQQFETASASGLIKFLESQNKSRSIHTQRSIVVIERFGLLEFKSKSA